MGQRFNVPDPFASPVGGGHQRGGRGRGAATLKHFCGKGPCSTIKTLPLLPSPPPAIDGHGGKGSSCPGAGNLKGPRAPDTAALL